MLKVLLVFILPLTNGLTPFFLDGGSNDEIYIYTAVLLLLSSIGLKIKKINMHFLFFIFYFIGLYLLILVNTYFSESLFLNYTLLYKVFFISLLVVVITQFHKNDLYNLLPFLIMLGVVISILILIGSVVSPTGDYRGLYGETAKNYLFPAIYVSVGVILSFIFFIKTTKLVYFLSFFICLFGSINALSRTTLTVSVLLILVLFVKYMYGKSFAKKVALFVGFSMCFPLLFYYGMSGKMMERFLENKSGDRINRWNYWTSKISSEFPEGGGLGVWYPEHPHNILLQYASEGGWLVFFFLVPLFVIPFFKSFLNVLRCKIRCKSKLCLMVDSYSAIYIIMFIEYMKSHEIHSAIFFWLILAIFIRVHYENLNIRKWIK